MHGRSSSSNSSSEDFKTATLYVDVRTRAIFFWIQHPREFSFVWGRRDVLAASEAIEACRKDLLSQLQAIGNRTRASGHFKDEAWMIEDHLSLVRDCESEADINTLRTAFGLSAIQGTLKVNDVSPVSSDETRGTSFSARKFLASSRRAVQ